MRASPGATSTRVNGGVHHDDDGATMTEERHCFYKGSVPSYTEESVGRVWYQHDACVCVCMCVYVCLSCLCVMTEERHCFYKGSVLSYTEESVGNSSLLFSVHTLTHNTTRTISILFFYRKLYFFIHSSIFITQYQHYDANE
jgi:hypothetical protein